MIEIIDEESQKSGITYGCFNCGTRNFDDDIKVIKIRLNSNGTMINLCKKCRTELALLLNSDLQKKRGMNYERKDFELRNSAFRKRMC